MINEREVFLMKKLKSLIIIFTLVAVIGTLVACTDTVNAETAYVTIDINPSVELVVNHQEKVIYVNALNEDAEILLAELDLIGMDVDEATDLIIETAILLGYIDVDADETVVSVSTISDTDLGQKIKTRVKEGIKKAMTARALKSKVADKVYDEALIEEAESYGVTPQFLFLAQSVVAVQDDITLEDALALTQSELVEQLKIARDKAKEVLSSLKDEFSADRDEIRATYQPTIDDIKTNIFDLEDQIEVLESEIAEASTEELLAELETLQASLVLEQAKLEETVSALQEALQALRDDYHAQSEALYPEIMNRIETRREQTIARIAKWIENHPDSSLANRIQEWKNRNGKS